ncbi:MAG: hypothetical protein QOF48_3622, partial [Verrucomicrobiota bacterium]
MIAFLFCPPLRRWCAAFFAQACKRSLIAAGVFSFFVLVSGASAQMDPPVITNPPASRTNVANSLATFEVAVSGTEPFVYRWFFQRTNLLADATTGTLAISNVQPVHAGEYHVEVTNEFGAATSVVAVLTVRVPPGIALQPSSLIATQGDNVIFSVVATGDEPLFFEWRRNGIAISAATNASLLLSNVHPSDSDGYSVFLWNVSGSITSSVATLLVAALDFGDAPNGSYPTLLSQNAARHVLRPGIHLGAGVTADSDGQPSSDAAADIDDGIIFRAPVRVGQVSTVQVVASTNGYLNAWIDFNRTNGWADAGEGIFTNLIVAAGTNTLSFATPSGAALGPTFARFRFSTISNSAPVGLAADGEVEDYAVAIEPVSDLALGVATPLPLVAVGGLVAFTVNVTNRGPSAASNIVLVNQLSPVTQFLSASATQGACTNSGGTVTCAVGNLISGARFSVTLNVTAGAGTNQCASSVAAAPVDLFPANNAATAVTLGTHSLVQFSSGDAMEFVEGESGAASIYPSALNVSGLTAQVFKVTVTLLGITHTWPDDLDVVLVGPGGQTVMLMSDCGLDNPISDVTLTFDDDAATMLPDGDPGIVTGTYKPSNYGSLDILEAPAPPRPYGTQLLTFRGTNPNGTWRLYAFDDSPGGNFGIIADGWNLSIVTSDPIADLSVGQTASPSIAVAGSNLVYTISVTNRGPADARATIVDTLPASVSFISVPPGQGTCSNSNGTVTCDLGNIVAGATKQISLTVVPASGGTITNFVSVSGNQVDLISSNNVAPALVTVVLPAADLAVTAVISPQPALLGQPVNYTIVVTNRGPNSATAASLTDTLPALMTFISVTTSQGSCSNAGGVINCAFGTVAPGNSVAVSIAGRPGQLGMNSNLIHVTAAEFDLNAANNNLEANVLVLPDADFQLVSVPPVATVLLNQTWTHVLLISNRGPSSSTATLTALLPASVTFISATSSQGVCSNGAGVVTCQLNAMGSGDQATVTIVTRPPSLGSYTNSVTLAVALSDPDGSNNFSSAVANVVSSADLDLQMAGAPDPVWLGEDVVFTLAFTNRGPSQATGVAVTNVLPAGLSFVSSTTTRGNCSHVGNTVICTVGSLLPGAGGTISIAARALSAGFATNSARLVGSDGDPDPANNFASLTIRALAPSGQFVNAAPIVIPASGTAAPYPSTIFVSGLTASVFRVRVALTNLAHS